MPLDQCKQRIQSGEKNMKKMTFLILASFILVFICQSLEPIQISQDTGMAVLANVTPDEENQSIANASAAENQSIPTENTTKSNNAGSGFWSWGKIPLGYELDEKNGTLIEQSDEEWKPSI